MWSVGCVFAELLLHKALFKGKSEIDQLNQIFKELGTPNDKIWPGYSGLPCVKKVHVLCTAVLYYILPVMFYTSRIIHVIRSM